MPVGSLDTPERARAGAGVMLRAALLGVAAGAGLVGGSGALVRLFGSASSAGVTLGAVWAAAVAWGVHRPLRPGDPPTGATLGRRFLLLGVVSALGAVAAGGSRVLSWLGAGVDAGVVGDAIARAIVGGVALVPAGLLVGSCLRRGAARLPESEAVPAALAMGVAAAAGAALLATGASLVSSRADSRVASLFAGLVLLLAGALLQRDRSRAPDTADAAAPDARADRATLAAAFAIAFALGAYPFLGGCALRFAFANEFPGLPLSEVTFLTGLAAGAVLFAAIAPRVRTTFRPVTAVLLAGLAAPVAVALLARYAALPHAYATATAQAQMDAALRVALRMAALRTAPLGLLVGAAAATFAASAPAARDGRGRWVARAAAGAVVGYVVGMAAARLAVRAGGFDVAMRAVPATCAVAAAGAVALAALRAWPRTALALALAALALLAVRATPPADRQALLVNERLTTTGSKVHALQKHWTELDEDDDVLSATILRRGHERRLLVDGQFETSNDVVPKSHGLLAELPLAFHGKAKRLLIVGAGTGWPSAVAESHDVDRIDLFAPGPAAVHATAHSGIIAQASLSDARLKVRLGDPEDLLQRAAPYDVVLLQPSGGWTERSARAATVEFLQLVRDKLAKGGMVCGWVPGSALTREGYLVLFATWARVFPRVEVWAGQDGDLLLLADRDAAAHDFGHVLNAYRDGHVAAACRASWIATPETLLSQFLLSDSSVRHLVAGHSPSTRGNSALERVEAARRRSELTVNPVSGLAAIRDDVVNTLVNAPGEGFAPAIARAVQGRDLEAKALDLELDGKPMEAADVYKSAVALCPDDGALRRAFAALRSQQGIEYGIRRAILAAHAYLREAVEVDSTYAQGFANLGSLLSRVEDYDYAIACTGQAMTLAPDDDLFQLQMGRIWKARGYYDQSLPFYQAAIDLNPKNVDAAIGYVDAKLALEGDSADLKWGLDYLEKYRAVDPHHEDLLYRIGKLKGVLALRAKGKDVHRPADSTSARTTPPAADSTFAAPSGPATSPESSFAPPTPPSSAGAPRSTH